MKIQIKFQYNQPLIDFIFVETGVRRTQAEFVFTPEALTAEIRRLLLVALTCRVPCSHRSTIATIKEAGEELSPLSDDRLLELEVPWRFQVVEPTRDNAIGHIVEELALAVAAEPTIRAKAEQLKLEREQQKKELQEKNIQTLLAAPLASWLEGKPGSHSVDSWKTHRKPLESTGDLARLDPRLAVRIEEAARFAEELNKNYVEQINANLAAELEFLKLHGSQSQVERFEEGVLPEHEFSALLKGHVFAEFGEQYEKITDAEIEHDDDCHDPHNLFQASDHDGPVDRDQWHVMKLLREKCDAASVPMQAAFRHHRGYCSNCSAKVNRLSIRVTFEFAGEKYTREFAC